ncbi:hypothetical protein [Grimontia sp. SpTr1]|uniref:hypothetical protein n=1 Tax=Grimontia sp. SpTr1 TaxID=2995319 RepID=UPI00248C121B|nr:hypothetical protein [Grimontia sp. SpTr1]
MSQKIAKFLNSPLCLLVWGFIFTTCVGSYINNQYHEKSWRSKAQFEIFKEQLTESKVFEEELLTLASQRFTLLERVYFELAAYRLDSARATWKEYYVIVNLWNHAINANRNRTALLFGEAMSKALLDDTENQSDNPKSLHHRFRLAHYSVLETLQCMKSNCESENRRKNLDIAREHINLLGVVKDELSRDIRRAIIQKHENLVTH